MPNLLASNFRFRRSFATTFPAIEVDNLIQIQRASAATDLRKSAANPPNRSTSTERKMTQRLITRALVVLAGLASCRCDDFNNDFKGTRVQDLHREYGRIFGTGIATRPRTCGRRSCSTAQRG